MRYIGHFHSYCLNLKEYEVYWTFSQLSIVYSGKVKSHDMFLKRHSETFDFVKPKTSRYQLSAIPVMQRLLEKAEAHKKQVLKKLSSIAVPVKIDYCTNLHHCDNKNYY